jgi:hypothetical protein
MSSYAEMVKKTIPSSKKLDEDIKYLQTKKTQLNENLVILNEEIEKKENEINQEIKNEQNGKYPSSWYGYFLIPNSSLDILNQELINLYYDQIDIKNKLNVIQYDLKNKINQTSLNR